VADLERCGKAYARRYDLEQTFRFLKQTLGWVMLYVRLPEQAHSWSWLVAPAYTQLRLARAVVADQRLPPERPRPASRLTPGRVRRGLQRWRDASRPSLHHLTRLAVPRNGLKDVFSTGRSLPAPQKGHLNPQDGQQTVALPYKPAANSTAGRSVTVKTPVVLRLLSRPGASPIARRLRRQMAERVVRSFARPAPALLPHGSPT